MIVGRLFNTIGPRQSDRHGMVVPRFVAQAAAGDPITVFGDGTQTRCFCSVHDVTRAILQLCVTPAARGEVFNIGSVERVSIRALAGYVCARSGGRSQIVHLDRPRSRELQAEVRHRQPDVTKLRLLTGWEPTSGWREVVDELVAHALQDRPAPVPA